jgi:SnoaL-like domain
MRANMRRREVVPKIDMDKVLQELLDKEAIRELVLLYSRGVDRKDGLLLRDLYTRDATDSHGNTFDGPADEYCTFLDKAFPFMPYSGHHVCNHLIGVDGDEANGEVYALAYHLIPSAEGRRIEDFMAVRYLDNYRREEDGRWRFSKRVVTYDLRVRRPFVDENGLNAWPSDPSYEILPHNLFQRGRRTG